MVNIINESLNVPRNKVREMFDYYAELHEFYQTSNPNSPEALYAKGVHDTLTNLFGGKVLPDGITDHEAYVASLNNFKSQLQAKTSSESVTMDGWVVRDEYGTPRLYSTNPTERPGGSGYRNILIPDKSFPDLPPSETFGGPYQEVTITIRPKKTN